MAFRAVEYSINGPLNGAHFAVDAALRRQERCQREGAVISSTLATLTLPYLRLCETAIGLGADLTGGRQPVNSMRDVLRLASPHRLYAHH